MEEILYNATKEDLIKEIKLRNDLIFRLLQKIQNLEDFLKIVGSNFGEVDKNEK